MMFHLLSLTEFIIIILLLFAVKGYEKERRRLKQNINSFAGDARYKVVMNTAHIVRLANAIRLKLPQELHTRSFKKNAIVKEVCDKFYNELTAQ